jgi:hypothetical protein
LVSNYDYLDFYGKSRMCVIRFHNSTDAKAFIDRKEELKLKLGEKIDVFILEGKKFTLQKISS